MQVDDLRPADLGYQLHIDKVVKELLLEFDLPYLSISGTIEQRIEQILSATVGQLPITS